MLILGNIQFMLWEVQIASVLIWYISHAHVPMSTPELTKLENGYGVPGWLCQIRV